MPFIYYVKKGGLAEGDAGRVDVSSKRTGLWNADTSSYYDSIAEALTKPTTSQSFGDFVYVSHLHDKDHGSSASVKGADNVTVVSVDNANQENYLKGAKEGNQSTSGNIFTGVVTTDQQAFLYGIHFVGDATLFLSNRDEGSVYAEDCTFELLSTNSSANFTAKRDGGKFVYKNCTFIFNNVTQFIGIANGVEFNLIGGSINTAQTRIFDLTGEGGASIFIEDFDASALATSKELISINSGDDDKLYARASRCRLPTGGTISNSTSLIPSLNVIGNSLKIGTGGSHNHYIETRSSGDIITETGIYRTVGAVFPNGVNFSSEMSSNSTCNYYKPLRYKLASFYIDTDDYTTTIDFKVHFARDGSSVAYLSDEFHIEADFNDGASDGFGASINDKPVPFATGSSPTTETSLWTGLGGTNKQMSRTLTATIGASAGNIKTGVVTIYIAFGVSSDTVFVCNKVEVS